MQTGGSVDQWIGAMGGPRRGQKVRGAGLVAGTNGGQRTWRARQVTYAVRDQEALGLGLAASVDGDQETLGAGLEACIDGDQGP